MNRTLLLIVFLSFGAAVAQTRPATGQNSTLVDRVGDTGFVQVKAESFRTLDAKQQTLAYWLTQAAIAIDPIIYDQLSAYGLREKRLLEEIVAHDKGIDPQLRKKITDYAKLFWGNRGNHNDLTAQKFLPQFTFDELKKAALTAQKNGAFKSAYADLPPLTDEAALTKELDELNQAIFDSNFEPMDTAKSPEGGKDIIQASSNTFYPGLSLNDLKDFKDAHALNSRVVRGNDGKFEEQVYRAGTPDGSVPPGLYATYLKRANEYLEKAQAAADPQQAQAIGELIRYYQTGDYNDLLKFDTDWVQDNAVVDFANGFIEVYRDARGAKGSSQAFVSVTDKKVTDAMIHLAQNAEYFEAKAPWDAKYKKTAFKPPVVKAIETLVETGDFSVLTVGDNLPNENEIHEKYGTKNFLFTGSSRALSDATGTSAAKEFDPDPETLARDVKYGNEARDLFTALHEVIGHGSGKLSEWLTSGAQSYLKEYFSTLEEARADLMALWNAFDPKLKELRLISNQDEVAKAMYDSSALVALTQLRRIQKGDTIEEDHERDRALIEAYIKDKVPGSIEQFDRNGKTYIRVKDYQLMRKGVGMLLAELMRIKGEGDYDAIKALVDKYGVHFDPALRDQVVARYKKLNLPTYFAGINPMLTSNGAGLTGVNGSTSVVGGSVMHRIEMTYPRDAIKQYLFYGSMYDEGLKQAAGPKWSAPKQR
ncbi:MAG: peptidase [Acidobacteria bacterium]|nr:peptidase [Acidobacteriota bacterium]